MGRENKWLELVDPISNLTKNFIAVADLPAHLSKSETTRSLKVGRTHLWPTR
jgi:hypothetical protein